MEGYLLKRGAQDHKRWCTLKAWNLTWWSAGPEEGKKQEVLGVLDLRGSKFLTTENLKLTFKIEGGVPLNSSKLGKDYVMTSDNEEDFKKWKAAIEKAAECDKNDKVVQKGYLMKESAKGAKGLLSRGGAERRWFELKGHIMTYRETEDGKVIGQLDLRGAKVGCRADSLAFTLEGPILNVQKKGKAYELAALTFEEMRSWTECLKRACESQGI